MRFEPLELLLATAIVLIAVFSLIEAAQGRVVCTKTVPARCFEVGPPDRVAPMPPTNLEVK